MLILSILFVFDNLLRAIDDVLRNGVESRYAAIVADMMSSLASFLHQYPWLCSFMARKKITHMTRAAVVAMPSRLMTIDVRE